MEDPGTMISLAIAAVAVVIALLAHRHSTRSEFRKETLIEGAKNQVVEEMRAQLKDGDGVIQEVVREVLQLKGDMGVVKTGWTKNTEVIQQHLIDCAKNQGRMEQKMDAMVDAQAHTQRGVETLQRSLANLMQKGTILK